MKKRIKRAFSIIELVIVIAIIAILAAVLIPTFANVVHKANESADVQVVRQINTLLTAENPKSSGELKQGLEANGINAENCTPIVNNTSFYWVPAENVVVYVNEGKQQVTFPEQYQDLAYNPSSWLKFPVSDSTSLTVVTAGQATVMSVTAENEDATPVKVTVPDGATTASVLKLIVKDVTPGGISRMGDNVLGNYVFQIALVDENGTEVSVPEGQTFKVEITMPAGLNGEIIQLYCGEEALAGSAYSYDSATGVLTVDAAGFEPYTVRWNGIESLKTSKTTDVSEKFNAIVTQYENGKYQDCTHAVEATVPNSQAPYGDWYVTWVFVGDEEFYGSSYIDLYGEMQLGNTNPTQASGELPLYAQKMTISEWAGSSIKYYLLCWNKEEKPVSGTVETRISRSDEKNSDYIVVDAVRLEAAVS